MVAGDDKRLEIVGGTPVEPGMAGEDVVILQREGVACEDKDIARYRKRAFGHETSVIDLFEVYVRSVLDSHNLLYYYGKSKMTYRQ